MAEPAPAPLRALDVERILELARKHLEMDVAYVMAFADGKQVLRALSGDAAGFAISVGDAMAAEDGYSAHMVFGDVPHVVPDTAADDRVSGLLATDRFGVGSFIGVPVTMAGGEVYGSFCCVSREPRPDLTQRDVRLLTMLAELLVEEIDAEQDRGRQRAQLQQLLDADRITIALQPIVDLASGRCVGMEALSRFPAGFGPPDVVFAAAHSVGVGVELERLAVRSAFDLLASLRDPVYVGLNVGPAVALELTDVLPDDADVPWHRLVLEITEHAVVPDYAELRDALRPLRKKGLRIAVDDAGAGYASMQHVVEMRPDIIKVDRTLVDGLAGDPARRSVVSAFVLLAYELGAIVLAEGVETAEDLHAARRLGATTAQGYVIARPSADPADHRRWGGALDLLAHVAEATG